MKKFNLVKIVGFAFAVAMVIVAPTQVLAAPTAALLPMNNTVATVAMLDGNTDAGINTGSTAAKAATVTTTAPLSDVIAQDADGNNAMYTTLRDINGKVVATNDPQRQVDIKYTPTSEGGEGVTVDKGATLYVLFRMTEIVEHNGTSGIQQDTTYTMDLPSELIPSSMSSDGQVLIDPEAPIPFFNAGGVKTTGGIYTKKNSAGEPIQDASGNICYSLHIIFSDVEGYVDVAGEYQFSTTLSETVEGGSTVMLTYVPGGKLSFKVTEDPVFTQNERYGAEVTSSRVNDDTYSITSKLTKTTGDTSEQVGASVDTFNYGTFTVKTDGNQGVWIDWGRSTDASAPTIFNNYGKGDTAFTLALLYANGEKKDLEANSDNITKNDAGQIVVRFTDDIGTQADVLFNGVLEGSQSSETSYIATSYDVSVTDGNGNAVRDLREIELTVPTILTGDYTGVGEQDYCVNLTAKAADEQNDLSASGSLKADLGTFKLMTLAKYNNPDRNSTLEFLPASNSAYLQTNSESYSGNYYWTEFLPNSEATINENYYVSLASFLPNKALVSNASTNSRFTLANGKESTFINNGNGPQFGLYGKNSQQDWEYAGTVSIGELLNHNLSEIDCFSSSITDAKLQYQLRKVFASADSNQRIVVYRSVNANNNGKYSYIAVDPRTVSSAVEQQAHGWYNFRDGVSEKAGSWRLHIFNAPNSLFQATFPQYLGMFDVNDTKSSTGQIIDKAQTGNGIYNEVDPKSTAQTSSSDTNITKMQATYMDAEWVSDDVVFWKMTINVANWQKWSDSYLYVQTDSNSYLCGRPDGAMVSGAQVNGSGNGVYCKQSDGSWAILDGNTAGKMTVSRATSGQMINNPTIGSSNQFYGYKISMGSSSGDTIYRSQDNNNTITLGFFTKVQGMSSADSETYSTTAQLVCHTGDATLIAGDSGNGWPSCYGSYCYDGQWAYRASATGYAFTPSLQKSGVATDDSTMANLETLWTLQVSKLYENNDDTRDRSIKHPYGPLFNNGNCYGGYSGHLAIGDTMKNSTVTDASGQEVGDIDAGKYTHITQMFVKTYPSIYEEQNGGGCGPLPIKGYGDFGWEKYIDGEWKATNNNDTYWDSDAPGIYRRILSTSNTNSQSDPMAIYVYYAGNMSASVLQALGENTLAQVGALVTNANYSCNSVVVEYRGLHQVRSLASGNTTIDYKTQTDVQALYDAANKKRNKTSDIDSLTQRYNVNLDNSAGFGTWYSSAKQPVSETISTAVTAALSANKSTPGIAHNQSTGGIKGSYTVSTQVGLLPTEYVNFEDCLSGFDNIKNGSEEPTTSYVEVNEDGSKDATGTAALKDLSKAITLKDLKIIATDLVGNKVTVYENDNFTGDWRGSTLNLGKGSHAGSLFCGEFKRADGENIAAGTLFTFTYNLELNMDGENGFRASDYYDGAALKLYNGAMVERPYETLDTTAVADAVVEASASEAAVALAAGEVVEVGDQTMQFVDDGLSLSGSEIDADAHMLRVQPDGDVEATYLSQDVLQKTALKQDTNNDTTTWMFWDWTGTQGKGSVERTLTDLVSQSIDISLLEERTDLSDAQKQAYLLSLGELLAKHTTLANVKLYLSDTEPSKTNGPNEEDLIWQLDGVVDANKSMTTDGHEFKLTYIPAEAGLDDAGENLVTGPGFTVSANNLGYNRYFASTYDTILDREAFLQEAIESGLLNLDGTMIGTTKSCAWTTNNSVDNGGGQNASATSGEVEVSGATISKNIANKNAIDGIADWSIDATTGFVGKNTQVTISDEFKVVSDEDAVSDAALRATSVGEVNVTYDNTLIWKSGSLTSDAENAGWTADNIAVSASGSTLEVTIKNSENFKPIADNIPIKVTYTTKLDKNAYAQYLGEANIDVDKGAYELVNAAAITVGNLKISASDEGEFTPEVPVSAKKASQGHPGEDLATTRFMVTGKTGDANREQFYLYDSPDVINADIQGNDESSVLSALQCVSFNAVVTDADGNETTFTAEDILSGNTKGYAVELKAANGDDFKLSTPGVAGWRLTFNKLACNTTVVVTYDLMIDRATYIDNGGEEGKAIQLQNLLQVGAKGSTVAGVESEGEVAIPEQINKTGALATEKAPNGNPIINWTLDVYLEHSFSTEELTKMQSVSVRDQLNPALKVDVSQVKVYDFKVNSDSLERGDELSASDFEATVDDSNLLTVTIKNPAVNRNVRIIVPTEVAASLASVTNTAELVINGKAIDESTVDEPGADAVTQWGKIASVVTPTFTPAAEKYVDGIKADAELAGKFSFSCVQVDEKGEVVDGGYVSLAKNDEDGNIIFETISYQSKPREGTYYYLISENESEGNYSHDSTTYFVQVVVAKNQADGNYLVSSVVKAPANTASVRFDNFATRDLAVAKSWIDDDNAKNIRPSSVTVHLCQDGKVVEGIDPVKLSELNDWSYTWKNLPIAGGEYSVAEETVEGYESNVGDIELGEDGIWHISVVNTIKDEPNNEKDNEKPDEKSNEKSDEKSDEESGEDTPVKPTNSQTSITTTSSDDVDGSMKLEQPIEKDKVAGTGDITAPTAVIVVMGVLFAAVGCCVAIRFRKRS